MDLKVAVFLTMLKLAWFAPGPIPDPDVNVNVYVNVNENNGNNALCCVYGGKAYPNGAILDNSCMVLECCGGSWKFIDKIKNDTCGRCALDREPYVFTYERNSNNDYNATSSKWDYTSGNQGYSLVVGDGYYVLSQSGLNILGDFGVYANFTGCEGFPSWSCINGLTYYEPGINVTVEDSTNFLPVNPPNVPLGAIKIYVNGKAETIDGSVSSFPGTAGPVLVFKSLVVQSLPPDTPVDCINIVGSKGLTVNFCHNNASFDSIWIWAMPHLKAVPTSPGGQTGQLYGLCDQYTKSGAVLNYYTKQDGNQTIYSSDMAASFEFSP